MLDTAVSVLVVDDSATICKVVGRILNQIGFADVESTADAQAALQRLREKKFGLVVADWYMDGMHGIEMVRLMQGNYQLKAIPVILMSAQANAENVVAAREAGAYGYLVKPFSADALKTKLDAIRLAV